MKSSHGEVTSVELFKGLQQTALSSKACGTVVNYTSSLNRWVKFANTNKLVVFPVSVVDAALFFSHLATSQVSASVIESSYCALKWAHDFAGVPNPMSSTFVKNMVEGAKRQNAKPTSKKSPISKEALTAFCSKHENSDELPTPPGGGDSHMKQTGMLVVSLRGVNFGFWSRLGCSGQSVNILSRQGLV